MVLLTEKQKRFADEYLIDLNATRAYKAAYPNIKNDETAAAAAARLLRNVNVSTHIEKRIKEREKRTEITQDMVLRELAAIGFANGADFAKVIEKIVKDEFGNVVIDPETGEPLKYKTVDLALTDELTEEKKKALAGIKHGKYGVVVETCDKVKALELLGKHLGMFDKSDSNEDAIKKLDAILEGIDNAAK